jgi:peptide/nickel transport system permease protein
VGQWWLSIFPSIIITLIVLQISLIGDWVRDVLDPRIKA